MNTTNRVTFTDPKDLADWLMVQSHGKTYLGRPLDARKPLPDLGPDCATAAYDIVGVKNVLDVDRAVTLDPVFEYVTAMQPMPQQTPAGVQMVMVPTTNLRTCFGLFTATRLRIVSYGTAVRVGDLDADERKVLFEMVRDTIEALAKAKAQRAGITLAPANAMDALKRATQGRGNGGLGR